MLEDSGYGNGALTNSDGPSSTTSGIDDQAKSGHITLSDLDGTNAGSMSADPDNSDSDTNFSAEAAQYLRLHTTRLKGENVGAMLHRKAFLRRMRHLLAEQHVCLYFLL